MSSEAIWNSERLNAILRDIAATKPIGSTGLACLDDVLEGGLYPDTYVLAAEPGAGKTTLALSIADHVARFGNRKVLYFALEMSAAQMVAKSISHIATKSTSQRVGMRDIQRFGEGSKETQGCIQKAIEIYRNEIAPNIATIDKTVSVADIQGYISQAMQGEDYAPLIVVDYAQLLRPLEEGSQPTDYMLHTSNMRALCELARNLKTPVLVVSSLNRNSRKQKGKGFDLSALSGSSEFEYGAACVMFLTHNEDVLADNGRRVVTLCIAKNRFGQKGASLNLVFDAVANRFFEHMEATG